MTKLKLKRPNINLQASKTLQLELDGENYGSIDVRYFNPSLPYHRRVSAEFIMSLSEDDRNVFNGEVEEGDDAAVELRSKKLTELFMQLFCTYYITDSKLLNENGEVVAHDVNNLINFFSDEWGTMFFEQVVSHAQTSGNYKVQAENKSKKK